MPDAKSKLALELDLLNGEYIAKIKKTKDETKKFTNNFEEGIKNLSGSWSKFVGLAGGRMLVSEIANVGRAILEIANEAGQIQSVQRAYNNMAASFGRDGKKIVESVKETSAGTVSNIDIMKNASLAMSLMGEGVIDMLPEMARIAKASAQKSGEDVSKMLEDIIVASGRRSIMILDNLGISSADAAKYQEEFAAKLGKTRDQMNDTQKSQAFFYAVMKAGGTIVDRVGQSALTLGEKLQIMKAQTENAKNEFLQGLTPALNTITNGVLGASGSFDIFAYKIGRAIGLMLKFVTASIQSFDILLKIQNLIPKLISDIAEGFQGDPFGDIKKSANDFKNTMGDIVTDVQDFGKKDDEITQKIINNTNNRIASLNAEGGAKKKQAEDLFIKEMETYFQRKQLLLDYYGFKYTLEDDSLIRDQENQEKARSMYEQTMRARMMFDSTYFKGLQMITAMGQQLMQSSNKKIFRVGQALAIANTLINSAVAVVKGMSYGPFIGIPYAALVATATAISLNQIRKQKPPSMAVGAWRIPRDMEVTAHRNEMLVPPAMSESIRRGDAALSSGTAGGGEIHHHSHLYLDGKQIGESVDVYRNNQASLMGVENYSRRSVYK